MGAAASPEPVRVLDNPARHRYEARRGDEVLAFVTYRREPGRITFLHAETDRSARGQGVASRLAAGALDDARAHQLAVQPFCPFIAEFIDDHPEYEDLVAPRRA
jgi:predicted GNAT family acetyltransferase